MKRTRLLVGVFTVLVTLSTAAKADPIGYIGPNAVPQPAVVLPGS
ncbi:hypothetical protein [Deinococcus soli (ex Cha et al. 2016)]|nr:hypothetical protein [Deinococcus soli (ex Cha et al. 2016)]